MRVRKRKEIMREKRHFDDKGFQVYLTVYHTLQTSPNYGIFKLDWSVYTCLTQLYDGRVMYRIYYIKSY